MQSFKSLLAFVLTALLSLAISPFFFWAPKVLGCRTNNDPSAFLAYCDSTDFGDFEHGAYLWDLEPDAVTSLRSAKVIFFGNSRLQFAFSTEATRTYFQKRHVPYYLIGFGYTENMIFAQRLIEKYHLRPQAVIINSDVTFFGRRLLPVPSRLFKEKTDIDFWKAFYEYLLKAAFSHLVRPLCNSVSFVCAQDKLTLWRRSNAGEWLWKQTFDDQKRSKPIDAALRPPLPAENIMKLIENSAGNFLQDIHVSPGCTILTAIPNNDAADRPIAERIGGRYGLPIITPTLDGLSTIDGSHLNEISAERWSEAFLNEAAPILDRCISDRSLNER
jgi:hypothetical protein